MPHGQATADAALLVVKRRGMDAPVLKLNTPIPGAVKPTGILKPHGTGEMTGKPQLAAHQPLRRERLLGHLGILTHHQAESQGGAKG